MTSRKKIVLAIFCGLGVILVGYFSWKTTNEKKVAQELLDSFSDSRTGLVSSEQPSYLDSDGDGLADWEEILWKTDPSNPDTDGDGMSDGDEVKANRDPAVFGPGDLSAFLKPSEKDNDSLTTSEKLSRDILSTYLKLKIASETGADFDIESPSAIVAKNVKFITAPQYSTNDIKTVSETSENISAYEEAFYSIFLTYFSDPDSNEMEVFNRALQTGKDSDFVRLEEIASLYRNSVRDMLSLSVPVSMASFHLKFVNALSYLAESISGMGSVRTDTVAGIEALRTYMEISDVVITQLSEFNLYFNRSL